MATWQEGYTLLQVRTTHGAASQVRTGILTNAEKTTVGIQVGFGASAMLDVYEVTELIKQLQKQRGALIKLTGGL